MENPYLQYFCEEEFFQHALVFGHGLTRWRQRMGKQRLADPGKLGGCCQDRRRGAARPCARSLTPRCSPDAKLVHRARERLMQLAQNRGVRLRQFYRRVGQARADQRYAHAHHFRFANKALRKLKTHVGRDIRTRSGVHRRTIAATKRRPNTSSKVCKYTQHS